MTTTLYCVKKGLGDDGIPRYAAFETLKEAQSYGRSIGAKEVVQMEVRTESGLGVKTTPDDTGVFGV